MTKNGNGHAYPCPGCAAREEQLIFLREQVRTLQDKLISFVPEAANNYHRLQLTQMANMRPGVMDGVVPLSETVPQNEEQAMDQFLNGVIAQAQGGRSG